ncbi:hypothetical protein GCM10011376_19640 [Nocardioides flavus (ex Wang et al. 2016)]|uniref:DUF4439 domain-containing protein n=1 Tax=Nocardioides flavus (ex Wang et al. 2016) TaxID=2058780 RepID=A0ABQ3HMJ7_9ACTN|nr:hypothetical protein [Nocardioides flavus (ex Wang et al. 2016)]GHE17354.1 hypothetical protein GCM10011376_19640 [Nocardioides flavus (ex Wang et al. 2016)]
MPGPSLTRRTAVVSAVGSALTSPLVLAGCDIDPPRSTDGSPASPPPPEDAELVASVVAELVRAAAVLEAATLAVPGLTPRLAPVADAHAAHLDLLVGAVADTDVPTSAPPSLPPDRVRTLAAVVRSERRLQREVRQACVTAASGDLARVLASVAASTAQHGASLARDPGGTTAAVAP